MAAIPKATEAAQEMEKAARAEARKFEDAFVPNASEVRKSDEKKQVGQHVSQWESRWGKMSDPKMQERIRRTAEALRAAREQTAKEDAQGSIEGLMGMSGRQRRNVAR